MDLTIASRSIFPTPPQCSEQQQRDKAQFFAMLSDVKQFSIRLSGSLSENDPARDITSVTSWLPERPEEVFSSLRSIELTLAVDSPETFHQPKVTFSEVATQHSLTFSDAATQCDRTQDDDDACSENDIEQHLLSEGDDAQRHTDLPESTVSPHNDVVLSSDDSQIDCVEQFDDVERPADDNVAVSTASSYMSVAGPPETALTSSTPAPEPAPALIPAAAPPSVTPVAVSEPIALAASPPAAPPIPTYTSAPSCSAVAPANDSGFSMVKAADTRASILPGADVVNEWLQGDSTPGSSSSSAQGTSTAGPSRGASSTDDTSVASEPASVKHESAPPEDAVVFLPDEPRSTSDNSGVVEPSSACSSLAGLSQGSPSGTGPSESYSVKPTPPQSAKATPSNPPRLDKGKKRARDDSDSEPAPETSAYTFDPEVSLPKASVRDDKRPTKRSRRTAPSISQVPAEASSSRSNSAFPAGPSKFFQGASDPSRKDFKKSGSKQSTPADPPIVVPDTNGRPVVMIMSKHRSRSVDIPEEFSGVSAAGNKGKTAGKRKRGQSKLNPDTEPETTTDAPSPPKKAKRSNTRNTSKRVKPSTTQPPPASGPSRSTTRKAKKAPSAAQPEAGPSSRPRAITRKTLALESTATQPITGSSQTRTKPKAPSTLVSNNHTTVAPQPATAAENPSRGNRTATKVQKPVAEGTRRSSRLNRKVEVGVDVGEEVEVESQDV